MNTLPKLEVTKYELNVPSTGESIEFRPFLVKEEKILMIAQESKDPKAVIRSLKDIIKSCTFGVVDPSALTSYDLEYIFLQLRMKSVGETAQVMLKCEECGLENEVEVDLAQAQVIYPEKTVDPKIQLTDTVGIILKNLSVKDLEKLEGGNDEITEIIAATIESIYDEDNVYTAADSTKKEMSEFVDSLEHKHLELIQEYITNTPKLVIDIEYTCSNPDCKHINKVRLEGIQSFFN